MEDSLTDSFDKLENLAKAVIDSPPEYGQPSTKPMNDTAFERSLFTQLISHNFDEFGHLLHSKVNLEKAFNDIKCFNTEENNQNSENNNTDSTLPLKNHSFDQLIPIGKIKTKLSSSTENVGDVNKVIEEADSTMSGSSPRLVLTTPVESGFASTGLGSINGSNVTLMRDDVKLRSKCFVSLVDCGYLLKLSSKKLSSFVSSLSSSTAPSFSAISSLPQKHQTSLLLPQEVPLLPEFPVLLKRKASGQSGETKINKKTKYYVEEKHKGPATKEKKQVLVGKNTKTQPFSLASKEKPGPFANSLVTPTVSTFPASSSLPFLTISNSTFLSNSTTTSPVSATLTTTSKISSATMTTTATNTCNISNTSFMTTTSDTTTTNDIITATSSPVSTKTEFSMTPSNKMKSFSSFCSILSREQSPKPLNRPKKHYKSVQHTTQNASLQVKADDVVAVLRSVEEEGTAKESKPQLACCSIKFDKQASGDATGIVLKVSSDRWHGGEEVMKELIQEVLRRRVVVSLVALTEQEIHSHMGNRGRKEMKKGREKEMEDGRKKEMEDGRKKEMEDGRKKEMEDAGRSGGEAGGMSGRENRDDVGLEDGKKNREMFEKENLADEASKGGGVEEKEERRDVMKKKKKKKHKLPIGKDVIENEEVCNEEEKERNVKVDGVSVEKNEKEEKKNVDESLEGHKGKKEKRRRVLECGKNDGLKGKVKKEMNNYIGKKRNKANKVISGEKERRDELMKELSSMMLQECAFRPLKRIPKLNQVLTHPSINHPIHPSTTPSIHQPPHLSINHPIHPSTTPSIHQPPHPSINHPIHPSTTPSIHQPLYPSINHPIRLSTIPSIYQPPHPSINYLIHPSVTPSIHQSHHSSISHTIHPSITPFIHQPSLHSLSFNHHPFIIGHPSTTT